MVVFQEREGRRWWRGNVLPMIVPSVCFWVRARLDEVSEGVDELQAVFSPLFFAPGWAQYREEWFKNARNL
ncbi:hypothetical protein [Polaromonas sp.]|uniref:hypothetical protein n=1 Tax=Polaromonas sp. TaxID=1869339 RepID=UPI001D632DDF|nr:hypothetical protein [Polaromonas sp.]MBT9475200.1 hypothetical protein [Polaromonas sp.]